MKPNFFFDQQLNQIDVFFNETANGLRIEQKTVYSCQAKFVQNNMYLIRVILLKLMTIS